MTALLARHHGHGIRDTVTWSEHPERLASRECARSAHSAPASPLPRAARVATPRHPGSSATIRGSLNVLDLDGVDREVLPAQ